MKSNWLPTIAVLFIMLIGLTIFAIRYCEAEQEVSNLQIDLNNVQEELRLKSVELELTTDELKLTTEKLLAANTTIEDLKNTGYKLVYLGDFKVTHYCTEKREHICGTGNGITATGTQVTAGRTIAVDPKVIPYGTKVYIEGYGWRIAEDCGGAVKGNRIDMAVDTHAQAISMGIKTGGVWVLIKTS